MAGCQFVGPWGALKGLHMNKRLAFAAVAALALAAAPALAQSPSSAPPASDPAASPPPSTSAAPPAGDTSAAPSASASGADVSVTTGMPVKDNTGATIGSVSDVKTDADGKKTATIKMGTDTFAVDTSRLAVAGGSATVNATQAEIKKMLKK